MTTTAPKTTTKTIDLTLNGFHGYITHRVRAVFAMIDDGTEDAYSVTITPSAAKKFACRSSDCTCGEGMPEEFECDAYDFEHADVTIKGNYPQR